MVNTIQSIVKQYNKSGRDNKVLNELQTYFKENGTPVVEVNNEEFILQRNYSLSNKVLKITKKNLKLQLMIQRMPKVLSEMTVLSLLESELVQTNNIENVHTDRNSVRELLKGNGKEKKYREQQIVEHYQKITKNELELNIAEDISKLYYDFLANYIEPSDINAMGKLFRKESVVVMSGKDKVIHTGVEGEENIHIALEKLLNYLNNSEDDILIKVSVFHYLFGYIHPFYDGNGRMSRLITAMYLYPEISFASLAISDIIATNQSVYYKMFEETNSVFNVKDVTSFVFQFLQFIEEAIDTTQYHLNKNLNLLDKFFAQLEKIDMHEKAKEIISILYQASLINGDLCTKDLVDITGLTNPTVKKYTRQLEEQRYITSRKEGKQTYYAINPKIELFNSVSSI